MNSYLQNSHTNSSPVVRAIHTAVKGRARYKVHGLYGSESLKKYIELKLKNQEAIRDVFANPLTGNVLVTFQPNFSFKTIALLIKDIVLYFQEQSRKFLAKTSVISPPKSQSKGKNGICKKPPEKVEVDMNQPNEIIFSNSSVQFTDTQDIEQSTVFPTKGDKRMYIIEVINKNINTNTPIRHSRQLYTVSFEQLSRRYQEIHSRGGKIISVKAV
jgi:CpcD/allophycocyanin linker domain/Heavy metal associated domain 2